MIHIGKTENYETIGSIAGRKAIDVAPPLVIPVRHAAKDVKPNPISRSKNLCATNTNKCDLARLN